MGQKDFASIRCSGCKDPDQTHVKMQNAMPFVSDCISRAKNNNMETIYLIQVGLLEKFWTQT